MFLCVVGDADSLHAACTYLTGKWVQDHDREKENRLLTNSYSAVVKGRQSVEIRPQVSGTITEICVKEGAKVHKGQVLFVIDHIPYKAALQTALANVKSAEAVVATARLTFDSKEELFKERVVSDFDRQTAQNSLLEAEASPHKRRPMKPMPATTFPIR